VGIDHLFWQGNISNGTEEPGELCPHLAVRDGLRDKARRGQCSARGGWLRSRPTTGRKDDSSHDRYWDGDPTAMPQVSQALIISQSRESVTYLERRPHEIVVLSDLGRGYLTSWDPERDDPE
jgi:hypothetical protein